MMAVLIAGAGVLTGGFKAANHLRCEAAVPVEETAVLDGDDEERDIAYILLHPHDGE